MFKFFLIFFKQGFFAFGGGYSLVSLIEKEIVENYKLMPPETFTSIVSIASSLPGPVAINVGIFVGYFVGGVLGAIIITLGAILPSFFIVTLVGAIFSDMYTNEYVVKVLSGVKPVVAVMIFLAGFRILRKSMTKDIKYSIFFVLSLFVLVYFKNISIAFIIFAAILIGVIIYFINIKINLNKLKG